jgi:hypothetical protein
MDTSKKKRVNASWLLAIAGCAGFLTAFAHAATWEIEVVDHTGSGRFSTLKIDRDGNCHVSFVVEDAEHTLKYGFWDHRLKRWFVMPVATGASFSSMALDSKQRPHIAWADFGTGSGTKLRYAHFDGTRWEIEPVRLSSDVVGYYTSIAMDSHDMPSISFYEMRGPKGTDLADRMRVVTRNEEGWEVRTVDADAQSGKFNSIAVDSHGGIHLAYANVSGLLGGMRYAYGFDKAWRVEILEGLRENNNGYVGFSAAIAVDKDSNPHVTYMNQSTGAVKYAVRRNGSWQIQAIDKISKVGYPDRNSITLDEDGRPYITYYDGGAASLKIAYLDGNKWVGEVIDRAASGFTSSAQIHDGMIWVSYADDANGGLKVAHAALPGKKSGAAQALESAPKPPVPTPLQK